MFCSVFDTKTWQVIDRVSFVFKLQQGEWVSPAGIEAILELCGWVQQALVVGRSPNIPSPAALHTIHRCLTYGPPLLNMRSSAA